MVSARSIGRLGHRAPIPAQQRIRRHRAGQVDTTRRRHLRRRSDRATRPAGRLSTPLVVGTRRPAPGQLRRPPRRLLLRRSRPSPDRPSPTRGRRRSPTLGGPARPPRPRPRPGSDPSARIWSAHRRVQHGCVDGCGFGRAAVDHRFAFEPPPLPRGRFPAHRVGEPVELLVDPALHITGAGGELDTQVLGHVARSRRSRAPGPPSGPRAGGSARPAARRGRAPTGFVGRV